MTLCDKIRDVDLVDLGVLLDDREDGKALVKLVGKEEALRIREEKNKVKIYIKTISAKKKRKLKN